MQPINLSSILWLLFIRDWPWKLLSFAIALMIYFSVRSEISELKTIAVPIMGDSGHVVTSARPQTVHVTLRGSATELSRLYLPAIYFAVAPTPKQANGKAPQATEMIRLNSSALRQIGRLRVVRIDPSSVRVQFEQPARLEAPPPRPPPAAPGIPSPLSTNPPPSQPDAETPPAAGCEQPAT